MKPSSIIQEDVNNIVSDKIGWEVFKNKTVLITGARSYICFYIIATLLKLNDLYNYEIIIKALCRDRLKSEKHFNQYINRNDFELLIQDVSEPIDVDCHIDYIIHAASAANSFFWGKKEAIYALIDANIIGLKNVLNLAQKNNSTVLYFSSSAVYGSPTPSEGAKEDFRNPIDFANKKNNYRICKMMCEQIIANADYLKVLIVRPSIIYGPGITYSQKKHTTDFLKNAILNEPIELKSEGKVVRDFCYIKDAVSAIFYVLIYGQDHEAYNVSSKKGIRSVKELAQVYSSLSNQNMVINAEKYKQVNYLQSNDNQIICNPSKVELLGWEEKTDLNEGVSRTIRWALENKEYFMDC